jgi:histone acetyltransferase (RNA polymerase elongator complex component)
LVVAVHSQLHARSYRVISEHGPLDKCFPREQMEGDMDPQNTIKDIASGSVQLQREFSKWAQVEPRLHKLVKVGSAIVQTSAFGGARAATTAAQKAMTIEQMKHALRAIDPTPRLTKPTSFTGTQGEFLRQQCEQFLGNSIAASATLALVARPRSLSPRPLSPRSERTQIPQAKGSG